MDFSELVSVNFSELLLVFSDKIFKLFRFSSLSFNLMPHVTLLISSGARMDIDSLSTGILFLTMPI